MLHKSSVDAENLRTLFLAIAIACVIPKLPCQAQGAADKEQHRVTVGPSIPKPVEASWETQPRDVYDGRIARLDGANLIIVLSDGKSRTISSDRVERIDFTWQQAEVKEALQSLQDREYQRAITQLSAVQQEAQNLKLARWQEQLLIADMVRSADALGNPRTAAIIFKNLADSSPPALLYADAPLCWTTRDVPATLIENSVQWLSSEDETEQLIGASWQLLGKESVRAKQVMQQLSKSDNATIAKLARVQSWRLVPPPQTLRELPAWLEYRETLIRPLQLGATEFLADRLMRIGEVELAIGQLARIASQHSGRYHRSAQALRSARDLLERNANARNGNSDEVQRLDEWIEKLGKSTL